MPQGRNLQDLTGSALPRRPPPITPRSLIGRPGIMVSICLWWFVLLAWGCAGGRNPPEAPGSHLIGVVWKLMEIQEGDDPPVMVDDPNKYTLKLLPDGKVQIRADCNRGFSSYALQGNRLSFGLAGYTRAACPPESLFDIYTRSLQEAETFVLERGTLSIAFDADEGIMRFVQ